MAEPKPLADVTKTLEVAFLGGSTTSAVGRTHRTAVEIDQRFRLVAGCFSSNSASNDLASEAYGVPHDRIYGSLESLLQAEATQLDALIILTPTDQHARQVAYALQAGVPVVCEKALATSSQEVSEVKKIRDANNGFLAVTYNYLGYPMVRELRHMIQNGLLGNIRQLHLEMPQEGFERVGKDESPMVPQEWRLHDSFVPMISLDLGTHLHMMSYFLTGNRPLSAIAVSRSYGNFPQIVDTVSCIAKHENEMISNIWYSKAALGERNGLQVRVFGDKGSAKWVQEFPEQVYFADNRGNRSIIDRASPGLMVANQSRYTRFKAGHPAGFIEAFANYYYDVADSLVRYKRGDIDPLRGQCFGLEQAHEGLRFLESIAASTRSGSWEDVEYAEC